MDSVHIIICSVTYLLTGSLFFDLVHRLSHLGHLSRFKLIRLLAKVHSVHHRYFDRELKFNDDFRRQNLLLHLPLELACQIVGSILTWQLFRITYPQIASPARHGLIVTSLFLSFRTCVVAINGGRDSHHISYSRLPKDSSFFFVGPRYHALHHIDPLNYYGSMTRLMDWVFGTSITLRGRRIAITGSSGSLGQSLVERLNQEKPKNITRLKFGIDWTYDDYSKLSTTLSDTDILILAHGTKSNADAEVWYIGSEAELHGAWTTGMERYTESKRAFARFARGYYDDEKIIYRHIVSSAFDSKMGPALVSARWIAALTLWWIRRGARYVPVTYTGIAYMNFFRFSYMIKPQKVQTR